MSLGNVLIFGDSYSTFEGYIPEGYAYYYSPVGRPETDVTRVTETWWHQVISETESELLLNNSWSGSTVCNTGYSGDCSKTNSFIYRFNNYKSDGFFEKSKIDTVFVFGGTNDSWANAPIGDVKFEDITNEDLFCVLPAMSHLLKNLRATLPSAKIYCLINNILKFDIAEGYKQIANHYGVTAIKFENIDLMNGHPTIKGMQDIKTEIIKQL